MRDVPEVVTDDLKEFWGGYTVEFKLIDHGQALGHDTDIDRLRRNAIVIGAAQKRRMKIDISKHEYCNSKIAHGCLGTTIYVYAPSLIVAEKFRAICQQMPEYRAMVRSSAGAPRARDFVDIWSISIHTSLDVADGAFLELLRKSFEAKRVPLGLLRKLPGFRDFHALDFESVKATMVSTAISADFDFYFDYVVALCARLESTGVI